MLCALFVICFAGSIMLGRYYVDPSSLVKILLSPFLNIERTWDAAAETVVLVNRLPRITAAALIGAALPVAGASFQGMFRNPMVSPDILGASSGAGFGAALGILLGVSYIFVSAISFIVGLAAVFTSYALSRTSRINSTLSMVLAGMMTSSVFSSATSLIKLVADTDEVLPAITYWLMGSISSIRQNDLLFLAVPVIGGLCVTMLLSWRMNLLTLGDEEAASMGINVTLLRTIVVLCATLMTAASVAVSGLIGWVGLVIPHFARLIFGYDFRKLIPASAILGATFLIVVDDVARLMSTREIPIGILTSFIGAPVFIWLILTGGARRDN